jgi:hypothetical protein
MFSTDASNVLASVCPTANVLACANGGSNGIIPSCVNGISCRAISVYDVTAMPDRSASIVGASTSIWGIVVMLSRAALGTGLAISIGNIAPVPGCSTPIVGAS